MSDCPSPVRSCQRRGSNQSTCSDSEDEEGMPCKTPRANMCFLRSSFVLLLVAITALVVSCAVPRDVKLDSHLYASAREFEAAEASVARRATFLDGVLIFGLAVLCVACMALSIAHISGYVRDVYRRPSDDGRLIATERHALAAIPSTCSYGGVAMP